MKYQKMSDREFMALIEDVEKRYGLALKALANIPPSQSDKEFTKWLKVFLSENSEILDELAQR